MTTQLQHAWAAGIIDGEGCISVKRSKTGYYQVSVVVGQSEPGWTILALLHKRYGGSLGKSRKDRRQRRLDTKQWQVVGRQANKFLCSVSPYLVAKRDQADLALAFRLFVGKPGERRSAQNKSAQNELFERLRSFKNYRR